jgi:hypothetical protein
MSQWVSLSQAAANTTREEDTARRIRIPGSAATVNALHTRLPQASQHDEVRWVRRLTVWIARLVHQGPRAGWCERWGLRPSGLSDWQQALRWRGLDRLVSQHGGGRPEPWTPRQNKRWVEWSEAGPLVGGGETACWHAVLIRVLIWRALGVRSHRHDVSTCVVGACSGVPMPPAWPRGAR